MTITVYIYANNHSSFEISDDAAEPLVDNNERLSLKEFDALADELADKFMECVGPDFPRYRITR